MRGVDGERDAASAPSGTGAGLPWMGVTGLLVLLTMMAVSGARAQTPEDAVQDGSAATDGRPSPAGAMVRSFILPGWGQAEYRQYVRGSIYFAGHVANSFMILKTLGRLNEANDIEDARVAAARQAALDDGLMNADSIRARINADPAVRQVRGLIEAREEQREDWVAFGVFWLLMSGVDAFVMAHLSDFPADIAATTDRRRLMISVSVPTP